MPVNQLSEELLNDLGEDFARRLRQGERPSIQEYSSKYPPDQAQEVSEFLESIAMLEDLKGGDDEAEAKQSNEIPSQFGRYQIKRTLGEGGMGAVYLAHDSQLDRRVALKTPKFAKKSDSNLIDRFYREARSAATLQHPNICPVYDVGELDGIHYISMAYIEGRSLSDYIKSNKLPPIAATVRVVRKVAIALHEAHVQGVVHRDLKPANIMIDRHNEPIVMDFGLARQFGTDEEDDFELPTADNPSLMDTTKIEARLTQDGTILGSPGYMSPEQISGKYGQIGPRSDVYALGVLLYELLTGELPFQGDGSLLSIVTAVITNDVPDASIIRRGLDPRLVAICRKAMSKKSEERYASMVDFAGALAGFLKSESDTASSITIPEASNNESASLVRAKEQCELARSLYQESQFAAAVSILEKMVADPDAPSNQYIEWARSELPKVRAKATQPVEEIAQAADDQFWNQDFAATTSSPASFTSSTLATPQRSDGLPRWFYAVVAVPIVVISLLVMAMLGRSFLRGGNKPDDDKSIAQPTNNKADLPVQPTDEPSDEPSEPSHPPIDPPDDRPPNPSDRGKPKDGGRLGNGPKSPIERLMQFDTNGDDKLSKEELRGKQFGPTRDLAVRFGDFDEDPKDGLLTRDELFRAMKELMRNKIRPPRRP